nr:zinc finger, CCHC-type, retrotransposon Gag domain protein [Tanacetum cinerariifolium]
RFLRLAGFLGAAAGTEEEQAKNFQWGLRRSTLNHLMCMSYTDVAQVANAARNYEILHERDDQDSERPDKRSTLNHLMCMSYTNVAQVANAARNYEILHERDDQDSARPDKQQRSGDRHQQTSQQSSPRSHGQNDNHRSNNDYSGNDKNSGNGRDQRNRGHQSNRSTNSGVWKALEITTKNIDFVASSSMYVVLCDSASLLILGNMITFGAKALGATAPVTAAGLTVAVVGAAVAGGVGILIIRLTINRTSTQRIWI